MQQTKEMPKRLINTEIWETPWFQQLPPRLKALWDYVWCQCDCAGIWPPNLRQASFLIGEDVSEADIIHFSSEIVHLRDGKWFVPSFISVQYNRLINPGCRLHRGVLARLKDNGIQMENGLPTPFLSHTNEVQTSFIPTEKPKKKESSDLEKVLALEFPDVLQFEEFRDTWEEWVKLRLKKKKLKSPETTFGRQLKWLSEDCRMDHAVEILNRSIRNDWQGLFDVDHGSFPIRPKAGSIPPHVQLRTIEEEMDRHPARQPDCWPNATTAEREGYLRLRNKARELRDLITANK